MFGIAWRSTLVRSISLLALLAILVTPTALAQPTQPQSVYELMRLADDVYTFRAVGHVSMFITTDEGVILVDPAGQTNPRSPSVLKAAIASVTDLPVRYVIYSHWGADHGTGGVVFADTATFVSHAKAAPKIAAADDPTSPVPDVTFDDHMSIDLGGKSVHLYAAAMGPEDDYLIVHYSSAQLIMTVDYVRPREVSFGDFGNANPETVVQRLQWIDENLDFDRLLWGHGVGPQSIGTREDLRSYRQYVADLVVAVRAARAIGLADNSPEMVDAVRTELASRYGTWGNFENRLPMNISGVIRWSSTR